MTTHHSPQKMGTGSGQAINTLTLRGLPVPVPGKAGHDNLAVRLNDDAFGRAILIGRQAGGDFTGSAEAGVQRAVALEAGQSDLRVAAARLTGRDDIAIAVHGQGCDLGGPAVKFVVALPPAKTTSRSPALSKSRSSSRSTRIMVHLFGVLRAA
jgi:hypothetical protein